MSYANDLSAGLAGEHLVCADILAQGFAAFRAEQHCAFDVGVVVENRLVRLQVKSTRVPRPLPHATQTHVLAYGWGIRYGKQGSRGGYSERDVDGVALVALDIGRIAYLRTDQAKQAIYIPVEGHRSPRVKTFEEFTFAGILSPTLHTCRECGAELGGTRARALYCSRRCAQRNRRARSPG